MSSLKYASSMQHCVFLFPDVQNVAILISDGVSTEGYEKTTSMAARAKDHGIHIVCVGVTDRVDSIQLTQIASSPNDVILVDDFSDLPYILQPLMASACASEGRS